MFKKDRKLLQAYIELFVFLVIGFFIIFFREQLINDIKYFVGAMMIFEGLFEGVVEITSHKKEFWKQSRTYLALIDLIFGINLLFIPTLDYAVICVIWASWSIVKESYEIKHTVTEIKTIVAKIVGGLESAVIIAFSIVLIMEPGVHHAMTHLYLFIIEIIFIPFVYIIDEFMYLLREKKKAKKGNVEKEVE